MPDQTEPTLPHRDLTHTPRKIIVFGATSGIAEATARIWAREGASLFLVARNPDRLAAVAADLKVRGAALVDTAVANLDDIEEHSALCARAVESLNGLDVAYLAVGILGDQPTAEQDTNHALQIVHTNYTVPVSLLTWLANYMVKQGHGTLAVLSSVAGERGRKSNYVYGSSKAGLTAFLGGIRNRVDREGVHVLTVKPGPVKTSMTAGMKGSEKFADPDKVAAEIAKAVDKKTDTLYTPIIWAPIMAVIRAIPERIFKGLNL